MTRRVTAAICLLLVFLQPASTAWIARVDGIHDMIVRADWQYPWQLPPRFRNHCRYEYFTARPYCSDHGELHGKILDQDSGGAPPRAG